MPELSSATYSETDASNNTVSPDGWPEGMNPSGVNDSDRASMGAIKRMWGRLNGRYATTGAANAYVLTPDVALAAYVTGERYSARANFANTAACTLAISGLAATSIKKLTSAGKADPASGDIQIGPFTVEYDGTDLVLTTPVANVGAGTVTSVATGTGLTGGPITGSGTIDFDINNITEDTNPDLAADFVATYDTSGTAHKKVLLSKFSPVQAVQSAIEAETNENTYIPPDLVKHSPGVAKFWCKFDGSAAGPITPDLDYNVVDVTDNGTGDYTINVDTNFSTADWAAAGLVGNSTGRMLMTHYTASAQAAGTIRIRTVNESTGVLNDGIPVFLAGFGDQ